jgi:hypothetical protein
MAAENAGTIEAELRLKLTQMEKDALEAQKKMDALAAKMKKQGASSGDGFAAGMKKGFVQVDVSAEKLGKSIAAKLSLPITAVTVGIKAIQGLGQAFGDALMANEKFAEGVAELKSSLGAGFTAAVRPVTDFFANLIDKAARSVRQTKEVKAALDRIKNENFTDPNKNIATALEESAKDFSALAKMYDQKKKDYDEFLEVINNRNYIVAADREQDMKDLEEYEQKMLDAKKQAGEASERWWKAQRAAGTATVEQLREFMEIENELKESQKTTAVLREKNAITEQAANERKISALNDYINKAAEFAAKENLNSDYINDGLRQQIAERERLQELVKKNDEEKITAKLVKEHQDAAKAIVDQKKTLTLRMDMGEQILQQEIDGLKVTAAAAKTETERNAALEEAYQLELTLIGIQRDREWKALTASEAYIAASAWERDAILRDFNKITEGMKEAKEKAKSEGGFLESIFQSEGYDKMLQVGGAVIDAFDSISNAALDISRKHAEEQIAIVEAALNSTLEQIEAARQAELEAAGFAEAASEEEIQKQIDRAKEAGDEVLQYKLSRRKEELEINKKYDDLAKAAEEKAAREKADIEYKMAKEEHALQIIQAVNAGAMAVLQALKSAMPPINFVLAGLAGAAAAVQIGFLASNPPKPPQFADGGIVPGRRSDGDVQHVIATAGEVILNEAQQERVAGKLESRGYTQLTVILQVDNREMAQAMADVYGSGKVLIPVRGIAR